MAKRRGRPTKYTPALDRAICKLLASGMSLNEICKRPRMPHERTVRSWATDPKHPFSPNYTRAREVAYTKMADELLAIADDGENDYMTRKRGEEDVEVVNNDHISRSRLRVDTRKWLLSKMLPKVYGDKVTTEVTGKDGQPIQTEDVTERTPDDFARRIAVLLSGKAKANGHSAPN